LSTKAVGKALILYLRGKKFGRWLKNRTVMHCKQEAGWKSSENDAIAKRD